MRICDLKRGSEISDMNQIKALSIEILRNFDKFCKEHGLRYCLAQGTLLGAVRHKGFIPWDDDVDISMYRPDYDKLIKLAASMPENCKFFSKETNPHHSRLYGRICNTDYVSVDAYYSKRLVGYFGIDVFPIDAVPSAKDVYLKFSKKIKILRQMFIFSNSAIFKGNGILRAFFIKPLPILICKLIGSNRIYKCFMKEIRSRSFDSAEHLGLITGIYTNKEQFPKDKYLDLIRCDFEDLKLPIIRNYDEYLRNIYGDYMQPPPKEKQVGHHTYKIYKLIK